MTTLWAATFWEHANYTGNSFDVNCTIGGFNNIDLSQFMGGAFNNKITSLKVYTSWFEVAIYKNADYTGSKYYFRGKIEVPHLSPYDFNDAVSAIVVNGAIVDPNGKQGQGKIIIYKDANLTGLSTWVPGPNLVPDVRQSFHSNGNGTFPDNSISSLRLFPNTKVTLYKDPNYTGAAVTYYNYSNYLYDFVDIPQVANNDTCTSIKIEYANP